MRQWLVIDDIAVHEELFLVFHIFLEFFDDSIDISFLYSAADLVQARQIDFISFDMDIVDIESGFENSLEGVDLKLFRSSVRIYLFLSCFPIDDEIVVIGEDDTEIRSGHHIEILKFRDGAQIYLHTVEIFLSRPLDIDHFGSLEIMLNFFMPIALDEHIEIVDDFLDNVFELIIDILPIIMFGESKFVISVIGGVISVFGSFEFAPHLFDDTILE